MTLKTLIVDDEPLARDRLRLLLAAESDLLIVGECRNGVEALAALRTQPVDLLFLDVQMPGLNGLEVAAQLSVQHLPPTIFVTAYQEHAVEAFEFAAVDYLTKPVTRERLAKAVERVRVRQAANAAVSVQASLTTLLARLQSLQPASAAFQRFLVNDGDKDLIIPAGDVEWIEADDYYSRLHVGGRTFMLREALADLAKHLDPRVFVRVHRSAIVNLNHVKAVFRDGREEGMLQMRSDARVRTSRAGRLRLSSTLALDATPPGKDSQDT